MIILTAGHTGPNSGAQCATTQFDEGAENIWLRNRVAEILTNKYGLVVLMDDDRASLKLLTKALTEDLSLTDEILHTDVLSHTERTERTDFDFSLCSKSFINVFSAGAATASSVLSVNSVRNKNSSVRDKESSVRNNNSEGVKSVDISRATLAQQESESLNPDGKKSFQSVKSVGDINSAWHAKRNSVGSVNSVRDKNNSVRETTFLIDIHFNAHTNPNARGTEAIVSNDATTLELRFASRLAHTTSDALDIPLRCIKSESETPHHRLAMLHLTPQSIILEVCFCTSPEDVEAYRKNREKLAADLAWAIAELIE